MSGAGDGELQRKIEEYKARERIYFAGLIGQEAELCHLRQTAADVVSAYGDLSRASVRNALYDPTANMEVLLLRQKAREKDQEIERLREELEANRFDQRLPAGQALMRKCKALLTENHELGEEIREERLAEFRSALLDEQRQNAELLQKCQEAAEFCRELSQENEKLQSTISKVAFRLREARAELELLKVERAEAKAQRKKERNQQKAAAAAAAAVASSSDAGALPTPLPEAPQEVSAHSLGAISAFLREEPTPLQVIPDVFTALPPHAAAAAASASAAPTSVAPGAGREKVKEKKQKDKDKHKEKDKTREKDRVKEQDREKPLDAVREPEKPADRAEKEPHKEKDREKDKKSKKRKAEAADGGSASKAASGTGAAHARAREDP